MAAVGACTRTNDCMWFVLDTRRSDYGAAPNVMGVHSNVVRLTSTAVPVELKDGTVTKCVPGPWSAAQMQYNRAGECHTFATDTTSTHTTDGTHA